MANRNFVKTQKIKEIKSKQQYKEWVALHGHKDGDGEPTEYVLANPDSLPERDIAPTEAQILMGEAIEHLQGRQKEVYLMTYRMNKSQSEMAEILGITRSAVQIYHNRAVKFITAYCQGVLKNEPE